MSLFLQTIFKNGMKYFNGAFLFIKDSEKSGQNSLGSYILVRKDWEKSDQNSWGSYTMVGEVDDFWIRFDLLDLLLLTKTCCYLNFWLFEGCY